MVGRDNIYRFLQKLTERMPDAIRTVRHSRVVVDEAGNKAVKFKSFATGTYIKDTSDGAKVIPNASISNQINNLDESSVTKKDIAAIKESFADTNNITSYSYLAHIAICWHLNEQGKVHHVDNHSKMINLKPVTVAGQRVRK
jgi:hypothetical protein